MIPVVKIRALREMSSECDRWSGRCDEGFLENMPGVKGLSSSHISPEGTVWRLSGVGGMICRAMRIGRKREKTG